MKIENVVYMPSTTAGESWLERIVPPSPLCAMFEIPTVKGFAALIHGRTKQQD